MKVPMWYARNMSLSELGCNTVANVNKILKEWKKNPLVFLKMVMCFYLRFLSLKLLLLAVLWASQESLASCRESAGSWFLMPRGSCSHKPYTPGWTPCMRENGASFYNKAWRIGWNHFCLLKASSYYLTNNKKSSYPRWKIKMEE